MSPSEDEERLRRSLRDAHRDDAPPPFATPARPRARRLRFAPALVPLAALALALALVIVFSRPRPRPIAAERLRLEWKDPLAFLLEPPGRDVLTTVPRFETGFEPKGGLP